MRKLIGIFALLSFMIITPVMAQDATSADTEEKEVRKGRPNIPGDLVFDLGYNFVPGSSYFRVLGSRHMNILYHRDFRIGDSNFSFAPGLGLGLDRYSFTDSLETGQIYRMYNNPDSSYFVANADLDLRKSLFTANYIDLPVEFRYMMNPDDPARSFKVALGGKIGYLFRGSSKIKYQEDDQMKKLKDIQRFHLNDLRYGAYLRVGTGGFNFYVSYMFSPLFKSGEGHRDEDMNAMHIGLSFNGF